MKTAILLILLVLSMVMIGCGQGSNPIAGEDEPEAAKLNDTQQEISQEARDAFARWHLTGEWVGTSFLGSGQGQPTTMLNSDGTALQTISCCTNPKTIRVIGIGTWTVINSSLIISISEGGFDFGLGDEDAQDFGAGETIQVLFSIGSTRLTLWFEDGPKVLIAGRFSN